MGIKCVGNVKSVESEVYVDVYILTICGLSSACLYDNLWYIQCRTCTCRTLKFSTVSSRYWHCVVGCCGYIRVTQLCGGCFNRELSPHLGRGRDHPRRGGDTLCTRRNDVLCHPAIIITSCIPTLHYWAPLWCTEFIHTFDNTGSYSGSSLSPVVL